MWQLLKMLLVGGDPEESEAPSKEPAPTRVERLAPSPTPYPDGARSDSPLAPVKHTAGMASRSHVRHGGGLSASLAENLTALRKVLGSSADVVYRTFILEGSGLPAALVYIGGLVDDDRVNDFLLRPLTQASGSGGGLDTPPLPPQPAEEGAASHPLLRQIQQALQVGGTAPERTEFTHLVDDVLSSAVALLVDTVPAGLTVPVDGAPHRSIEDPSTESLVRGPREGFVESLRMNVALIRQRLKDPNLRVEQNRVGRRTKTDVAMCYIQDVANPHVVDEIRTRIKGIDIDAVLESGYLEQILEDNHYSPFPQIQNSERPDRAVANLLSGRVVILVDGTPFCLILPSVFNQFFQTPEDYYERFLIATMLRFIRVLALFFSLTFTALYVALISFHSEMLPTKFAVAVAGGRAGVPFPSVAEAFFMELSMEVLREAGLRLPKTIGQTVSIVGALVIGEAAVRAGIVSPLMVIVVALTSIGSFAVPSYSAAIALRIVKFPIILAAGTFGLYGVMLAIILLVVHLASLKSVGVPYLAPFAPARAEDMKDTIFRLPIWMMYKRPVTLRTGDPTRQAHSTHVLGDENIGVEGESGPGKPER